MHGRSKGHDLADGTHTRVKIDLSPEYIRHLPPQKRAVWDVVGPRTVLRPVKEAFMRRLAAPLQRRFGPGYAKTGMYPIPILTRDIPGYLITPHTDTRWKGITVQLYLPRDRSITHIGTIFHEPGRRLADRRQSRCSLRRTPAMPLPSAPIRGIPPIAVGPEIKSRDSILLTYFVDAGALQFFRNRGKRVGNYVVRAARNWLP